MSKTMQVRDVSDRVHSILKARAAREGMSPSDFIKRELDSSAERPTMREWLESTPASETDSNQKERGANHSPIADAR